MIPAPLLGRLPAEDWESLILKEYQKYKGKSSMIARMLYLQYVRQWSCYGSAWFPACKEIPPGGYFEFRTQKWLLGLNAEGFVVVDQNKYVCTVSFFVWDLNRSSEGFQHVLETRICATMGRARMDIFSRYFHR